MEEVYTIGETSRLNDVSVKSLRHYDDIGLLKPRYIDPNNGYRYYTYDQFSFIDKIKRYKNVGMSLKDLKELFQTQDLKLIETFLKQQKKTIEKEKKHLEDMKKNVEWLTDFFEYSKSLSASNHVFIKHIKKRYMISVPCDGDDSMYSMDMELRRVVSSPDFKNIQILNPYGYLLDYDKLIQNVFYPHHSTVCIREMKDLKSSYLYLAPEGEYVCCRAKILSKQFDITPLKNYLFQNKQIPKLVVACEYLTSLYDPANSPYEIQILI